MAAVWDGSGGSTDLRGEEGEGAELEPDEQVADETRRRHLAQVALARPPLRRRPIAARVRRRDSALCGR